jgi:hypothetical protein
MANINQPVPYGNLGTADTTNYSGVLFESAARTHTADPAGLGAGIYVTDEILNPGAKGVQLFLVSTSSGSGTVTAKIQVKDPASRTWVDLTSAATASQADPGSAYLTVYPGIAETSNVSVSDHLGPSWRVHVTVATASVTFSVGASYIV